MPLFIPIIISLVISFTASNIGLAHNFFKNDFVFDKMNQIRQAASSNAIALGKVQETLPVNVDAFQEPFKKNNAKELTLPSASGLAIDLKSGKLLYSKNVDAQISIASLSKLMTALVFLDHNPGWDFIYEMKAGDSREGSKVVLFTGEHIKVKDLFYTSLVASDNIATIALLKSTGLTESDFIALMNKKAEDLGLINTHFADPIGLANDNKSTAMEVAKFAQAALSNNEIKKATLTKSYEFKSEEGKIKKIYNTDNLLAFFPKNGIEIKGGKTGYIEAAGYCFVGEFTDKDGRDIMSVVLGSKDKDSRFTETHELISWAYENYNWQ